MCGGEINHGVSPTHSNPITRTNLTDGPSLLPVLHRKHNDERYDEALHSHFHAESLCTHDVHDLGRCGYVFRPTVRACPLLTGAGPCGSIELPSLYGESAHQR